MTKKEVLKYWLTVAEDDLEAGESLIKAKKFSQGLFFCHLALEKLIKGLVYKNTDDHPLPIHDLIKLFQQTKLELGEIINNDLSEINTWNIKARYDSYKREFYKKATRTFADKWLWRVKELFQWIENQY